MTETARRVPLRSIAVILSLVAPGLGHIYYGRTRRGLVWAAIPVLMMALYVAALPQLIAALGAGATLGATVVPSVAARIAASADLLGIPEGRRHAVSAPRVLVFAAALVLLGRATTIGTMFGVRALGIQTFKIPSGSMIPTLLVGDHIFVDKSAYRARAPRRGELMVFAFPEHPGQDFIKRVIAIPGDRLEVKNGHPFLNGWEVPHCAVGLFGYDESGASPMHHEGDLFVEYLGDEAYLTFYEGAATAQDSGPFDVTGDDAWVLGDNRNNAYDSRMWWGGKGGGVPRSLVKGRAMTVWLSVSDEGIDGSRFGADLTRPLLPRASASLAPALERCLRERPARTLTSPPP